MKQENSKNGLQKAAATLLAATSLVCGSLAIPACDTGDEPAQADTHRYSGEELYVALIFDTGPASGRIAALSQDAAREGVEQMTDEQFDASLVEAKTLLEELGMETFAGGLDELEGRRLEVLQGAVDDVGRAEVVALVTSMIEAEDPDFFDDFAERIHSGDHYLVAEAMADAGAKTLAHTMALGLENTAPADADRGFCVAFIFFITYVGTINMTVNINVSVNINITETMTSTILEFSEDSLGTDALIDEITTTYAR